jgi:hypothetical protein
MISLFIHYVCVWPIVGRVYYISRLINFNYSFMSKNVYPNYTNYKEYEEKLDVQAKIFSDKRNDYIIKKIIFPLFSLFFILWGLSLLGLVNSNYKSIDCYLYSFANNIDVFKLQKCENYFSSNFSFIVLTSSKYFLDFALGVVLFTLLYSALKFKIKKDFLNLKLEMFSLVIIWYLCDNGYHLFKFDSKNMCKDEDFFSIITYLIDSSMNLSFLSLYLFLTFKIKNFGEKKFLDQLNVFQNFIRSPVYFCYFKDFLKNNPGSENQFYYLFFWKNYNDYKMSFRNNDEEFNRLIAKKLYEEYFVNKNEMNNPNSTYISKFRRMSNSTNIFNTTGIIYFSRLLPDNIIENIEEAAYQDFRIDDFSLFHLYDEAFNYIESQLLNSFFYMMNIQENREKLINLIGWVEFDFLDKIESSNSLDKSMYKLNTYENEHLKTINVTIDTYAT